MKKTKIEKCSQNCEHKIHASHTDRFPTLAVNCEFLPIAIPHYITFGRFLYYLCGQSVGHKIPAESFICRYCVVKIPD